MNFIRPEVQALLRRWSEVIAAGVIVLVGIWFILSDLWIWQALGVLIAGVGMLLAFAAWRRVRFSALTAGPGLVEVDERQISYFAPYEGGAVSIDFLARITAVGPSKGGGPDDLTWVLEEDGGSMLTIPNAAAGAQDLFDAFAALPDVNYANAQRALEDRSGDSFVIWAKPVTALH